MSKKSMQELLESSYLSGGSTYLENMYEQYMNSPESVPAELKQYFEGLPKKGNGAQEISHQQIQKHFADITQNPFLQTGPQVSGDAAYEYKQAKVEQLVRNYRRFGHLAAKIDPLGAERPHVSQLDLSHYDLSKNDYSTKFRAQDLMGQEKSSLKDILEKLKSVYCNHIGYEFMDMRNEEEAKWIQNHIESDSAINQVRDEVKKLILQQLISADGFEKTLDTKYVGQKRFSLEGCDSLVPLLSEIIDKAAESKMAETVLGMAHRGRLNVMLNVLGLPSEQIFMTFEGRDDYGKTTGDVKYHLGVSSDVDTRHGPLHVALAFNPSHLEVIDAVTMGSVRAREDMWEAKTRGKLVLPILIHGDAAFAGQGIVMETLNMSQTKAYSVGGTIHIITNNQIGFTTSDPQESRTAVYCTDISRMIDAPVFHVNADDPEAVIRIARLAFAYRMEFHKDVIIDLVGYRRHGHNEADEPRATQPLMYQKIDAHLRPREIYANKLIAEGLVSEAENDQMIADYRQLLDEGKRVIPTLPKGLVQHYLANWTPYLHKEWNIPSDTTVDIGLLKDLGKQLYTMPDDVSLQKQVKLVMNNRLKMANGEKPIDWGFGENLAYATLIHDGLPIRITGQDVGRGTFGHRHAIIHDQNTDDLYIPLRHLKGKNARFDIYNSLLSEEGVLGFEYGYATASPKTLVIWEAQFGDFANGAQVIIDQFISSGWQKWQRLSGVTMFLPHGMEGMGPEHSSARLERFLQLCAQHNIQVCVPSTPSQIFHLIRRQSVRPYRKPLIVMTPKSLLRNPLATSTLEELAEGKYKLVIPEAEEQEKSKVKRVVLCCGKVYYDLLKRRMAKEQDNVAIVRIEQLYPFPSSDLKEVLAGYDHVKDIVWCQEEPRNQGAWYTCKHRFEACLADGVEIRYIGRDPLAAPAVGYHDLHQKQQDALVEEALDI